MLGAAALPSQAKFLQEVLVYPAGSAQDAVAAARSCGIAASSDDEAPEEALRFLWLLQLREDHCWAAVDILPAAAH